MKESNRADWTKEFREFSEIPELVPPPHLSDAVRGRISRELHPRHRDVLMKVLGIHFLVGALTLLICPQFGITPFSGSLGLMALFMKFGSVGCFAGCGAFFMGSSALALALLLRPEELRVFRTRELLELTLLSLFSFGLFMLGGSEIVPVTATAWIFGSVLGGWAILELTYSLRMRSAQI